MRSNTHQIVILAIVLALILPVAAFAEFKDSTVTEETTDESAADPDTGTDEEDTDNDAAAPELFEGSSEEDGSTTDDTQEDSTGILTLETNMATQSVVSGKIPLTITVISAVDSSKAAVTWDLPRGLTAYGEKQTWFRMEADVPYSFTVEIEPQKSGTYSIVVDVTAWRYDTNYVTSGEFEFEIDEQLHVTPAPEEYTRNLMIFRVGVTAGVVVGIIAVVFLVKFGIKRFKTWMAQD